MTTQYQRNVIIQLLNQLFAAENEHTNKEINLLIEENNKLTGQAAEGFNYLGDVFRHEYAYGSGITSLSVELMPRMARLRHQKNVALVDRKLIDQWLARLIAPCNTDQEIRDAIPDCLAALNTYYSTFSRHMEPAWCLKNNPAAYRQYLRILTKIEMYCAMRFLY